jgi:hypothetical protein
MGNKVNSNTYIDFDEWGDGPKAAGTQKPVQQKQVQQKPVTQPAQSPARTSRSPVGNPNNVQAVTQMDTLEERIRILTERLATLEGVCKINTEAAVQLQEAHNDQVDAMNDLIEVLVEKEILEPPDEVDDDDDVAVIDIAERIVNDGDEDDYTEEYDDGLDDAFDDDLDEEMILEPSEEFPMELAQPQDDSLLESPDGPDNEIRTFVDSVDVDINERDISDYVPGDYRKKPTINDRRKPRST